MIGCLWRHFKTFIQRFEQIWSTPVDSVVSHRGVRFCVCFVCTCVCVGVFNLVPYTVKQVPYHHAIPSYCNYYRRKKGVTKGYKRLCGVHYKWEINASPTSSRFPFSFKDKIKRIMEIGGPKFEEHHCFKSLTNEELRMKLMNKRAWLFLCGQIVK